jgi:hypothetical protein
MSLTIHRPLDWAALAATALILGIMIPSAASPDGPARVAAETRHRATSAAAPRFAKLPLSFEPNQGQADPRVKYLAHGPGYTLALSPAEATLVLTHATPPAGPPKFQAPSKRLDLKSIATKATTRTITVRMLGANRAPRIDGVDKLPGISNYFVGNDHAKWQSNIPNYAKVRYSSVYPGVDLVYYGTQGQLEYDLIVAPQGNPGAIRFAIDGADEVALEANGDLVMHAGRDQLALRKPVIYQEIAGQRKEIAGRFKWADKKTVGFEIASYDRNRSLIIDPGLVYATYIGGFFAMGHGIAVDSAGNAYVVGLSALCPCFTPAQQQPYPTTSGSYNFGATQPNSNSSFGVVVTKLSPAGSSLVYSTYFGGSSFNAGYGIALDPSGDAYVTGLTISNDFPTLNTNVPHGSGLRGGVNAFVTELNSAGSALVYSTYLGSSNADEAQSIAVDGGGNAYVVGWTFSSDFPTTPNAFQQTNPQSGTLGNYAGFLSKLSVTSGTVGLAYSTYVANAVVDNLTLPADGVQLLSVAVDGTSNAYVGGYSGINFPVTTGPAFGGKPVDALVARFDTTLNGSASLIYARYLGGNSNDVANAIGLVPTCASNCNAYVGGATSSRDFASVEVPVNAGAAQHTFGGSEDGFLAEVDKGGALVYWTYLGGVGIDQVLGLGVDGAGQVYATGTTNYIDFPTTSMAFQPSLHAPSGRLFTTTTASFPSFPAGTGWTSGSPGLTSIALDPATSPATIYAAGFRTGIFKSTNGGATFNPTAFNMPGTTSITINTNTTHHILIWTTGTAGIFESADGLASYSSTAGSLPAGTVCCITVVAGGADAPSNLYLGTTSTFYRSTDGGATFAQATGLPVVQVNAIVSDGAGNLFVGTDRGIFKSIDQGATFTATNADFGTVWALAADTTNHIVYAGDFGGVFSSNDGFNSNFVFASIPATGATGYAVAVDPLNPSNVYAGINDSALDWGEVFRSTDSGHTFPGQDCCFQGAVLPIAIDSTTSPETLYWGLFADTEGFLTQLSADGSTFLFSTYLGGSISDDGRGLTVDAAGSAYIVGTTHSSDFPATPNAYQTTIGAGGPGFSDLFVAKYPNTLPSSTGSTTTTPSTTTAVTFSNLTSPVTTTVTTSNTGPTPPAGFNFGSPATYYDFSTTPTFSGNATVCIDYVPSNYSNPSLLQLLHYQGGAWVDVTNPNGNDTSNGVICGNVTSLSPFAIGAQFEPLTKNNCKEGQWQLWTNPKFKNQGQCTKFVNHS